MNIKIHESTTEGIQLSIGNDQFGFNKQTGTVKMLQDGHWVVVNASAKIRQILQDRHAQALAKKAQEAAQAQKLAYLAKRPTYQNAKQRQRAAMDQFCMGAA